MDSRPFYAPQETHNPLRWILPVTRALCIGTAPRSFLFGGVGLGAAVTALETATGRPLIWATAQYLAYAEPNSTLDIDVDPVVEGNTVTQARVMGHVGGREILTVNAALGARDEFSPRQFAEIPVVPSPREAEGAPLSYEEDADLHNRFEIRPIQRLPGEDEGRARMWIRSREGEPLTAGAPGRDRRLHPRSGERSPGSTGGNLEPRQHPALDSGTAHGLGALRYAGVWHRVRRDARTHAPLFSGWPAPWHRQPVGDRLRRLALRLEVIKH